MSSDKLSKLDKLYALAADQSTTQHERDNARKIIASLEGRSSGIIKKEKSSRAIEVVSESFEMPPWINCNDNPDVKWIDHYNFLFKFHVRLIGFEINRRITHNVS